MDSRPYNLTGKQVKQGTELLGYQPFILSDDVQVGVAYSWLYESDGGRNNQNDFCKDRRTTPPDVWEKFVTSNQQLRNMYNDWIDAVCNEFPDKKSLSVVDVACNTGYFPVMFSLRGFEKCVGYDRENYGPSISYLNNIFGTNAKFMHEQYDSWTHTIRNCNIYDISVASLIMNHISDPLYFLAFLGKITRKALLLFTGMGETEQFLVYYSKPNRFYANDEFPTCFDNDTGLSRGLLYESLRAIGFQRIIEIEYRDSWLPKSWMSSQKALLALK